jgi:hypothetical protein
MGEKVLDDPSWKMLRALSVFTGFADAGRRRREFQSFSP